MCNVINMMAIAHSNELEFQRLLGHLLFWGVTTCQTSSNKIFWMKDHLNNEVLNETRYSNSF
jgi:hypothetical protein